MKRLMRQSAGFSLIEVAAGFLILSILMLGLMATLVVGSSLATGSSLMNQATAVAEGVLEELRSWGNAGVRSVFPPSPSTAVSWDEWDEEGRSEYPVDNLPEAPARGYAVWVVSEEHPQPGVIRVTVLVQWKDRGVDQWLDVSTLVGRMD